VCNFEDKQIYSHTDIWEFDLEQNYWRLLIDFISSGGTIELLNEKSAQNKFEIIRIDPVFVSNANLIL